MPEMISNAGGMLAKIAATRAAETAAAEVAPADGWQLPRGDVLMRIDAGRPSCLDGSLDVEPVYVRVRLVSGDENEAVASGAVADEHAFVQRDAAGALRILPAISVSADEDHADACDEALRVAAMLAGTAPIYEALRDMQVGAPTTS